MDIQSADLCFHCHSRPAWIGKTSREGWRIGQRATISCKNGHRRQKYFLSLIFSSFSIFTLWLPFIPHFPSCFIWALLFSSSPSWNILKIPPQVTGAVFGANLLDFHSIKQSSAKYLPRSGGWRSFPTPAGGKPHNKCWPLLATARAALHWQSMCASHLCLYYRPQMAFMCEAWSTIKRGTALPDDSRKLQAASCYSFQISAIPCHFLKWWMLGSTSTAATGGVKHSSGRVGSVWEAGRTVCAIPTLSASRSSGFIP